jgi:N-acetylneuraminate synthase/sialic acid synthase
MFGTDRPYVIAEIGQNHQGELDIALRYLEELIVPGLSAVKLQLRDNRTLFAPCMYESPYNSENAFGDTYGAHREKLELDMGELREIRQVCRERNVDFMITPFDQPSLERCLELQVDLLKVASFDLGNIPFLEQIGSCNIPVVMSTGGGHWRHIDKSVEVFSGFAKENIALLHCVSKYPCPETDLNLARISEIKTRYPEVTPGLSDHFNGILSAPLARMLGASVFEKHVTLNRTWKGTDHAFALTTDAFKKMIRDISRVDEMVGTVEDADDSGTEPVFNKLGKSIIAKEDLPIGKVLCSSDLEGRIFLENGIPIREVTQMIGKTLTVPLAKGQKLSLGDVQ